jgi:hypothetical protein
LSDNYPDNPTIRRAYSDEKQEGDEAVSLIPKELLRRAKLLASRLEILPAAPTKALTPRSFPNAPSKCEKVLSVKSNAVEAGF